LPSAGSKRTFPSSEGENVPVPFFPAQHRDGKLSLLVAEGESLPGPVLQIGNTNSRYHFSLGVKEFINRWSNVGPAHHCAIGIGHVANKLEKLTQLLGIAINHIC